MLAASRKGLPALPEIHALYLPPASPQADAKTMLAAEMRMVEVNCMMFVHTKFGKIAGKAGQNRALQMVVLERYARLSAIDNIM
jgi:hypothetical protein